MNKIKIMVTKHTAVGPTAQFPNAKPGIRMQWVEQLPDTLIETPEGAFYQDTFGRTFNVKLARTPLVLNQVIEIDLDRYVQYTTSFVNEKGETKQALNLKPAPIAPAP